MLRPEAGVFNRCTWKIMPSLQRSPAFLLDHPSLQQSSAVCLFHFYYRPTIREGAIITPGKPSSISCYLSTLLLLSETSGLGWWHLGLQRAPLGKCNKLQIHGSSAQNESRRQKTAHHSAAGVLQEVGQKVIMSNSNAMRLWLCRAEDAMLCCHSTGN